MKPTSAVLSKQILLFLITHLSKFLVVTLNHIIPTANIPNKKRNQRITPNREEKERKTTTQPLKPNHSALHNVKGYHGPSTWQTIPLLVPADVLHGLFHVLLVVAPEHHPLVPTAIAALVALEDFVHLRIRVERPKALEKLAESGVGWYMAGVEGYGHVGRDLPWCCLTGLEHMDLGVLRWKEVVVSGLASHAAGRVGHVDRGNGRVDDWVTSRGLASAGELSRVRPGGGVPTARHHVATLARHKVWPTIGVVIILLLLIQRRIISSRLRREGVSKAVAVASAVWLAVGRGEWSFIGAE